MTFIFVAVMGKPKELSERLIEDAEGVRKEHSALDYQVLAKSNAPCGAGKISKPVQRNDRGFLEWRDEKSGSQMSKVMLDGVKRASKSLSMKCLGQ